MTIDFEAVFKKFNEELSKTGNNLELICAGGYVMQRHGYRTTLDIDAFYKNDKNIDEIIKKVGNEFKINNNDELWLNNSIYNINPEPPDKYCVLVYKFSNLVVKEVNLTYLIGMKLFSQRFQDLKDVSIIIRQNNNEQPFELMKELNDMKFNIDVSLLLEAYEMAYGMEWLNNFYISNSEELLKYL